MKPIRVRGMNSGQLIRTFQSLSAKEKAGQPVRYQTGRPAKKLILVNPSGAGVEKRFDNFCLVNQFLVHSSSLTDKRCATYQE